jgi:predicted SAM-dependent methyltransferase
MGWPDEPTSLLERLWRDLLWQARLAAHAIRRRSLMLTSRIASRTERAPHPRRLHIGCGRHRLDGWINIDLEPLPGVDVVHDVTRGLPWSRVEAVYAEHFLEHLAIDEAIELLVAAHGALRPGGLLRLTTPSLEWIWATHMGCDQEARPLEAALHANRAFSAWGHRFLWSRELLEEALRSCGFEGISWCAYGESSVPELSGLEGHEQYEDSSELAHILVVECRRGSGDPQRLERLMRLVDAELLHHIAPLDAPRHARRSWWIDRKQRSQKGRGRHPEGE